MEVSCLCLRAGVSSFPLLARRVRSFLSPRCVGVAARRAVLSLFHCEAPLSYRPVCFLQHTFPPFGSLALGGFPRVPAGGSFLHFLNSEIQDLSRLALPGGPTGRIFDPRSSRFIFCGGPRACWSPPSRPKTFSFLGVAGGAIEIEN